MSILRGYTVSLFTAIVPNSLPHPQTQLYEFRKKIFWVSTMCAQILGFSTVRVRVRVRVRVNVSIRVSLVKLVCASTSDNSLATSVESVIVDGTLLVFARVPSGRNRIQCLS